MEFQQRQRLTVQRRIILEEVRRERSHPTADEIYERVRKKLPRISLGTVYRNLDFLSRSGLIRKLAHGPQMRFDGVVEDHYHIFCMACGRIEDVPIDPRDTSLDQLVKSLNRATEYKVFGHHMVFMGLCPRCSNEDRTTLGEKIREIRD